MPFTINKTLGHNNGLYAVLKGLLTGLRASKSSGKFPGPQVKGGEDYWTV